MVACKPLPSIKIILLKKQCAFTFDRRLSIVLVPIGLLSLVTTVFIGLTRGEFLF